MAMARSAIVSGTICFMHKWSFGHSSILSYPQGEHGTGAMIAPKLVLTAAHCVQPGADYKIVEYGADRQPSLQDVKTVAIHPGFNMQAMQGHRATADVALLQLAAPARGKTPAVPGMPNIPITVGSRFTIAGIGVTVRGDGKSSGTQAEVPTKGVPTPTQSGWGSQSAISRKLRDSGILRPHSAHASDGQAKAVAAMKSVQAGGIHRNHD